MKTEPLLLIGLLAAAVVAAIAIGLHLTGTPMSLVKDTAAILAPLLVALIGRTQVAPLAALESKDGAK